MPVFQLNEISKTYPMGEEIVHALENVSLTIDEGEFVAILGPSGSGKSTLMHIMGFMDQPTSGKIYLDGEDVSKLSGNRRARVRGEKIGFVFQSFNLLPRLSVLENVALPLRYTHIRGNAAQKRAAEMLALVGLSDRMKHNPGQLSGGQRQRVAIARALVNHPRLILADEPTGNLDSENAALILQLFEDLHKQGHTIVLVTHDPKVANRAKRSILVEDGHVTEEERSAA